MKSGAVFQCVPNISEGRRAEVITSAAESIASIGGVKLLDYSSDTDHNRSVFTLLGCAEGIGKSILKLYEIALECIDMHKHKGVHPRIGAVDVVPFVPIENASMEDAKELASSVAREVADRFSVPIYLYGESALKSERVSLAYLRRGGWEALEKEGLASPERYPDLGPARLHERLGASCFGARGPLVAFNVFLNTQDVSVAKSVAKRLRAGTGGLAFVKALGLAIPSQGCMQVSMNLTNPSRTALYTALEMVRMEARRFGVAVLRSELIGVMSLAAACDSLSYYMQLPELTPGRILENGLLELHRPQSGI